MSNLVDRSYPGALVSARGDTFLTTFNADRSTAYGHVDAIEAALEMLGASFVGKGTIPGNTATLTVDNPVVGRVYCPVGYKAVIGTAVQTTASIGQEYSAGVLNHVFLVLSTTGTLSLRVSTSDIAGDNEVWIGDVDTGGSVVDEPAGKPYAGISFGTAEDGTLAGALGGRYQAYTTNATPDTEDTVAHGLGRVPVGFIVVRRDKAGVIYDSGGTWTSTNILLKCNVASLAATILVF